MDSHNLIYEAKTSYISLGGEIMKSIVHEHFLFYPFKGTAPLPTLPQWVTRKGIQYALHAIWLQTNKVLKEKLKLDADVKLLVYKELESI